MGWLKKTASTTVLYHTSEIPYFLCDEYAIICDNNRFTDNIIRSDNYCGIIIPKTAIKRICSNSWCIKEFPAKIESSNIEYLFNRPKNTQSDVSDVDILIFAAEGVSSAYLKGIEKLSSEYDHTFMVSQEPVANEVLREMDDVIGEDNHFYCTGKSWHNPIISILDVICNEKSRDTNWGKNIPDTEITIAGLRGQDLEKVDDTIKDLNLTDKIQVKLL